MITRVLKRLTLQWEIKRDPVAYARRIGVKVGNDCRLIGITPGTFSSEPFLVSLGNHVTVAAGVHFVTHDGGVWIFRGEDPDVDVFGPIQVGDNVFVGMNALILAGVTIGDNSVIAAGAVVTRDVPSGSIVAGVPARRIKSVEEYRAKVNSRALRIRSLPQESWRTELENHFLNARNSRANAGQGQPALSTGGREKML